MRDGVRAAGIPEVATRALPPLAAALAALLLLAACSAPPASRVRPVTGTSRASLGRTASIAASSAEAGPASAVGTPVVEIDPAAYFGKPIHRASEPSKAVAITIDDGPSRNTSEVLGIFERLDARCTFFYVGNRVPRYRLLAKRAYESGFEIGDHTWDHQEIRHVSAAFVRNEIDRCQRELLSVTGHTPVFLRPPAGHWDDTSLRATNEAGLAMALWSLHGQDTGPGTHAATIAGNVIASARGGDVILLHETNPETVKALPRIIEGLRAKGLRVVTLSELLRR